MNVAAKVVAVLSVPSVLAMAWLSGCGASGGPSTRLSDGEHARRLRELSAEGVEVSFEGRAEDRGTDADELEMRWSSSLDERWMSR
ncbi:MAG: hypothetical protein CMJ84_02670 [Planctomycetes bacterium]|nr:hypothetical protein [Planctomycetota bacterium]